MSVGAWGEEELAKIKKRDSNTCLKVLALYCRQQSIPPNSAYNGKGRFVIISCNSRGCLGSAGLFLLKMSPGVIVRWRPGLGVS